MLSNESFMLLLKQDLIFKGQLALNIICTQFTKIGFKISLIIRLRWPLSDRYKMLLNLCSVSTLLNRQWKLKNNG